MGERKQRRSASFRRHFHGDYAGVEMNPTIRKLLPKRDKVEFSEVVSKYDRRFVVCKRYLVLTRTGIYMIGPTRTKSGPNKGQIAQVIKRKILITEIEKVRISLMRRGTFFDGKI